MFLILVVGFGIVINWWVWKSWRSTNEINTTWSKFPWGVDPSNTGSPVNCSVIINVVSLFFFPLCIMCQFEYMFSRLVNHFDMFCCLLNHFDCLHMNCEFWGDSDPFYLLILIKDAHSFCRMSQNLCLVIWSQCINRI